MANLHVQVDRRTERGGMSLVCGAGVIGQDREQRRRSGFAWER